FPAALQPHWEILRNKTFVPSVFPIRCRTVCPCPIRSLTYLLYSVGRRFAFEFRRLAVKWIWRSINETRLRYFCYVLVCTAAKFGSGWAQDVPKDYQEVLAFLSRSGDFKAKVLKINVPRNDLKVTIAGQSTPTPFGFGGWVAMTKGDTGAEVLMGDLVLTQDEVNPVMSALLEHGIEVTALHNHFFFEEPRLFYMHVHGHGEAMNLAHSIKPALDLIPKPPATAPSGAPAAAPAFNLVALDKIVGQQGESLGSVYKFTLGRDDLNLKEHGATINARMGLNSWAALAGNEADAQIA